MGISAQTIVGRVVDKDLQPINGVNVVALAKCDSTILNYSVTDENGVFNFALTYDKPFILRLSDLAYHTVFVEGSIGDIGIVEMVIDTVQLDYAIVKADRPQHRLTKGGIEVNVANSVLAQTGTLMDVLRNIPLVDVSADGNIQVLQKGEPEIYVNNQLVVDKSELSHIKSSDVKHIEVITSPSARYSATTHSVIIIKTSHSSDNGLSFSSSNEIKVDRYAQGNTDNILRYHNNEFEVFGNMYYYTTTHTEDNSTKQSIHSENQIDISQYVWNHNRTNGMYVNVGGCYDFNPNHSMGGSYAVSKTFKDDGFWKDAMQQVYFNKVPAGTIMQDVTTHGDNGPKHRADLYYNGKLSEVGIEVDFSYLGNQSLRESHNIETSDSLSARTITTYNKQRYNLLAGKAIFSFPLGGGMLDVGTDCSKTYSRGEFMNNEKLLPSSDTEINEKHIAGFMEYEKEFKSLYISLGLRYEYVSSCYYEFGKFMESVSRKYGNWYPSFCLSWQNGKSSIQFDYVCKTIRPNYSSLRNEVQYDNRYLYEGGNPYLIPSMNHQLELNGRYDFLTVMMGYEYAKNPIIWCASLFYDQDITLIQNCNFDHRQTVDLSVIVSPRFNWYQPTCEMDLMCQFMEDNHQHDAIELNTPGLCASIKNRFVVDDTFSLFLNFTYSTPFYMGYVRKSEWSNLNFQLVKTFFNKSLVVNMKINDILRMQHNAMVMYGENTMLEKDAYEYSQFVSFTVTYNLRSSSSKYKGSSAGSEERKRL